ncbi:MAG: Holliday junction resolvase RuvX [Pseudomonadota bacterium]
MTREDIDNLLNNLQPNARLAGLDWGSKTIGVAVGVPTLRLATPLQTLTRRKLQQDIAVLRQLCDKYDVGGLVVGLPLHANGDAGKRAQSVRDIMDEVHRAWPVPYVFWDERYSTAAMHDFLIEAADVSRGRRDQVIDKMAAQYILQSFFDCLPVH